MIKKNWPVLSYENGKRTYETLQLWTQIAGKIKLATLPWANHSWNITLHITPYGLSTQSMPYKDIDFQIDFNFLIHKLKISTSTGQTREFDLHGLSVAAFYERIFALLESLGIELSIMTAPSEIENPIPFEMDNVHASYDENHVTAFHQALLSIQDLFMVFRCGFNGKASPIHFFWGGFDLALAFFSGRKAPKHPGKIPGLPDWVLQDAYSHELMDFGFWTGSEAFPEAAFYCYLYPEPKGYAAGKIGPSEAYYNPSLGEYILPYSAVQNADDPEQKLLEFLRSTYEVGADLAEWDSDLFEGNETPAFSKSIL